MAAIILDFDGTIADSRDYITRFIAEEAKLWPLNEHEQRALHGLSPAGIAKSLGIKWWRLPRLYFKGRKRMDSAIPNLKPYKGMPEVIKKLHAEGHEIFIISSNSLRNIRSFLRHNNLHEYIMEINGGVEVFGKASTMRQLLKRNNLSAEQTYSIGDELRDVQAAQSLKLQPIAVTWGFADEHILRAAKPAAVAETPADIIRILEEL